MSWDFEWGPSGGTSWNLLWNIERWVSTPKLLVLKKKKSLKQDTELLTVFQRESSPCTRELWTRAALGNFRQSLCFFFLVASSRIHRRKGAKPAILSVNVWFFFFFFFNYWWIMQNFFSYIYRYVQIFCTQRSLWCCQPLSNTTQIQQTQWLSGPGPNGQCYIYFKKKKKNS